MLEFRILGPLEVACGSDVIALGGAKQRALLACLLLHAERGGLERLVCSTTCGGRRARVGPEDRAAVRVAAAEESRR